MAGGINIQQNLECVLHRKGRLAEGPVWDGASGRLIWVDILGQSLHFYNPLTGNDDAHLFDQLTCAAVPAADGRLLLAMQNGLYWYKEQERSLQWISSPESHLPGNRLNDGKCDPAGRFWVGSMSMGPSSASGSLYCMDHALNVHITETNVELSNGMGWSPDGTVMYFIDTLRSYVYAYDYDREAGVISSRRVLIHFPKEFGLPDGMTVDSEGRLWVAHWGGGRVTCWDPITGKELDRIEIPARLVTSCAFGGPDLNELDITTAVDDESGQEDPYGGSLFRVKPGVTGIPAVRFQTTMDMDQY